jgi:hypothetical protein
VRTAYVLPYAPTRLHQLILIFLLVAALVLVPRPLPVAAATSATFIGLNDANQLVRFTNAQPGALQRVTNVTGLDTGENLLGIDYRPATGQLYGLGSSNRIYTIDATSGVATAVLSATTAFTLTGTSFGFDFNPVPDRIRVVSDAGQNLRLNPITGAAIVDGPLNGATTSIIASAYTNPISGTTATTLYGISSATDQLFIQNPPNAGTQVLVGNLGVDTSDVAAFDIQALTNQAFAVLNVGGASQLYSINLSSGAATAIGPIGGGRPLRGLAIVPPAVTQFVGLTTSNQLVRFSSNAPGTIATTTAVTGLAAGENLLGIDYRPATGALYGLGSSNRLYTIDATSGAATAVVSATFAVTLTGTSFGFDFNPQVDRIRVVSNTGQNLRLNPITGGVVDADAATPGIQPDGPLNGASTSSSGSAYTNNFAGTASTTLYNINATSNQLFIQNPPNPGTQVLVGSLGVTTTNVVGFDIEPFTDAAFAALTVDGSAKLYSINLATGQAISLGAIGSSLSLRGLAIVPPAPTAFVGLTSSNKLVRFTSTALAPSSSLPVSGLAAGESLLGIDFRPATGQLYGLGSSNRLYTIDPATGAATAVVSTTFAITLTGTSFGFDFNPQVDRIRVVSNTGQNLRLNPITGGVVDADAATPGIQPDGPLNGATTSVVAAAYTNNFSGTVATTLYNIDATSDQVFIQNPPNPGTQVLVGALGVDVSAIAGFDIVGDAMAYAALVPAGSTGATLYRIDLSTGKATAIGPIGGEGFVGLAIPRDALPAASYRQYLPMVRTP